MSECCKELPLLLLSSRPALVLFCCVTCCCSSQSEKVAVFWEAVGTDRIMSAMRFMVAGVGCTAKITTSTLRCSMHSSAWCKFATVSMTSGCGCSEQEKHGGSESGEQAACARDLSVWLCL